jgi:hypothetical protein
MDAGNLITLAILCVIVLQSFPSSHSSSFSYRSEYAPSKIKSKVIKEDNGKKIPTIKVELFRSKDKSSFPLSTMNELKTFIKNEENEEKLLEKKRKKSADRVLATNDKVAVEEKKLESSILHQQEQLGIEDQQKEAESKGENEEENNMEQITEAKKDEHIEVIKEMKEANLEKNKNAESKNDKNSDKKKIDKKDENETNETKLSKEMDQENLDKKLNEGKQQEKQNQLNEENFIVGSTFERLSQALNSIFFYEKHPETNVNTKRIKRTKKT